MVVEERKAYMFALEGSMSRSLEPRAPNRIVAKLDKMIQSKVLRLLVAVKRGLFLSFIVVGEEAP